jgi:aspartyl-tRNA(Asn)/glutamyl-tRNA(Gln) amidotransferase subunit C
MAHIVPLENVLREDVLVESPPRDLLLANAPAKEDGFLFVPQVVE